MPTPRDNQAASSEMAPRQSLDLLLSGMNQSFLLHRLNLWVMGRISAEKLVTECLAVLLARDATIAPEPTVCSSPFSIVELLIIQSALKEWSDTCSPVAAGSTNNLLAKVTALLPKETQCSEPLAHCSIANHPVTKQIGSKSDLI